MREYEEGDIDTYLEYVTALWRKVEAGLHFESPEISIKKIDDSGNKEFIDEYMKAAKSLVVPVKEQIFLSMVLPFSVWLYTDCPLTDHKARKRETAKPENIVAGGEA